MTYAFQKNTRPHFEDSALFPFMRCFHNSFNWIRTLENVKILRYTISVYLVDSLSIIPYIFWT